MLHNCRGVTKLKRLSIPPSNGFRSDQPAAGVSSTRPQGLAVGRHVLVVLGGAAGEAVVPVVVTHEVEVFGFPGIQSGLQGGHARVGDGPGRQSGELVGVVRRVELQV